MEKNKIKATIVADSIDPRGNRITSYILTFPRFILPELLTHRMFSRNSASSRAIPFEKMVKMVEEDPFIPIAWQKDHKGMQGTEYITPDDEFYGRMLGEWLLGRDNAIKQAKKLNAIGVTKQLCNRILEPFMWHTTLVTATSYDNFFELRCPQYLGYDNKTLYRSKKDFKASYSKETEDIDDNHIWWLRINKSQAEIHIQALAEAMWDARNESIPKELSSDQWHIPFGDKIDLSHLRGDWVSLSELGKSEVDIKLKIAVARAARLSYNTHDGEINYERDIQLHDRLLESKHCFDPETEILTATGWKFFPEITKKDLIAQVDVNTGNFCGFCEPIKVIKTLYTGKVYKYNSNKINLFITEGHKLLGVPINKCTDRKKSYESLEIFEANKKRIKTVPTARVKFKTYGEQELKMFSAPKPKNIDKLNQDYLKGCLAGFFIGDGFRANSIKIKFRLKRLRKINFLKELLQKLNLEYEEFITNKGASEFKIVDNNEFSIFYSETRKKTIPIDIYNENFIYGLFEGLKNSDGSRKGNTWVYDTSSKELHDRILDLCPLVGLTGFSNPSYPVQKRGKNHAVHYRISFSTNNHILVNDSRTPSSRVVLDNYEGMVYCVEVPKHGIIVRRGGKTIITHNCSPFEHCARVMTDEEYVRFIKGTLWDDKFEVPVPRPEAEGWCNNFRGFVPYRYLVENNLL